MPPHPPPKNPPPQPPQGTSAPVSGRGLHSAGLVGTTPFSTPTPQAGNPEYIKVLYFWSRLRRVEEWLAGWLGLSFWNRQAEAGEGDVSLVVNQGTEPNGAGDMQGPIEEAH